ncbi:MAG: tetratricopeptide repeat protein, partial [Bacteroidales bacterium]
MENIFSYIKIYIKRRNLYTSVLIPFFIFNSYHSKSQYDTESIDSLIVVSRDANEKERASIYNKISRAYWHSSVDSSKKYAKIAYSVADKEGFIVDKLNALNNLGVVSDLQGEYSNALQNYFRIIEIANRAGYFKIKVSNSFFTSTHSEDVKFDSLQHGISLNEANRTDEYDDRTLAVKKIIANAYVNIGIVYGRLSQYEKSLVSLNQSLIIRQRINDNVGVGVVLFNMGTVYVRLQQLELARSAYRQSIAIRQKFNDHNGIANGFLAMGQLFKMNERYDSARFYLNSAREAFQKLNNKHGLAQTITAMGEVFGKSGQLNIASSHLNQALLLRRELKDREGVALVNVRIGDIQHDLEEFSNAVKSYKAGLSIAKDLENKSIISEALHGLAQAYEKQGNIEASYSAFKEFHNVSNEINDEKYNSTIAEFQTLFKLDIMSKENDLLRKNNEINRLALEKKKSVQNLLIIIVLIVFFSSLALLFLFRSRVKTNKKLKALNLTLEKRVNEKTYDLREALNIAQESNDLKNSFLSNISHEIRTPLNGIMGFTSLLASELPPDSEGQRYIQEVNNSSNRLMHLLNNLIDYSRIESSTIKMKFVPCSIVRALQKAIDKNFEEIDYQNVKLKRAINEVPDVLAEFDNLVRVFSLIINNALKYSPEGEVLISTAYNEADKTVEVVVADSGVGIDAEYLPYVFEPFRQESSGLSRSFQGAGLGLPLAKRLLTIMGGDISLTSKKGVGTEVRIKFFLGRQAGKDSSVSGESAVLHRTRVLPFKTKAHKAKILIIEENSYTRFYLQALLRKYANVIVARDGSEALSILSDAVAKRSFFDLVLVDAVLPQPWSPITLIQEFYKRKPEYKKIPFIIQVDNAEEINIKEENLLSNGYQEVVTKPIDKDKILS